MPELPDVVVYIEHLTARVVGQPLERVRLATPFLVRSVDPPLGEAEGRRVIGLRRLGKRIVLELEGELFLVFHLMIAGRFRWRPPRARPPGKVGVAAFEFPSGTLVLTEASSRKRASLHMVRAAAARGRRPFPRAGDRFPRRHGRAWSLPSAVPRLRCPGAAHRLRGERDQLLRALPDGRRAARRSVAVAAAQERLAPEPRRAGGGQSFIYSFIWYAPLSAYTWSLHTRS